MRGRFFNYRAIARAAGFAAVAVAIIAAGIHLARRTASAYEPTQRSASQTDAFSETLSRCATFDDTTTTEKRKACEAAWAENRRRFFGDDLVSTATTPRAADHQSTTNPRGR